MSRQPRRPTDHVEAMFTGATPGPSTASQPVARSQERLDKHYNHEPEDRPQRVQGRQANRVQRSSMPAGRAPRLATTSRQMALDTERRSNSSELLEASRHSFHDSTDMQQSYKGGSRSSLEAGQPLGSENSSLRMTARSRSQPFVNPRIWNKITNICKYGCSFSLSVRNFQTKVTSFCGQQCTAESIHNFGTKKCTNE